MTVEECPCNSLYFHILSDGFFFSGSSGRVTFLHERIDGRDSWNRNFLDFTNSCWISGRLFFFFFFHMSFFYVKFQRVETTCCLSVTGVGNALVRCIRLWLGVTPRCQFISIETFRLFYHSYVLERTNVYSNSSTLFFVFSTSTFLGIYWFFLLGVIRCRRILFDQHDTSNVDAS